ncbi:peptidase M4 [Bacillus massilinigeriensis]|uniref:peptidase M4 n=1 Tax=Bacillus mediterraneensis TaxID=1805474 RepID=UPI0008F89030|nr:peptidase M4 [Bacillus mediterraneensis]
MNWKSFLLGVGAGLTCAYALKEAAARNSSVTASKALGHAKAAFKKEGPILGSWINMNQEVYQKGPISFTVYKGGISRSMEDGKTEQFEFVADASTGSIIDVYRL